MKGWIEVTSALDAGKSLIEISTITRLQEVTPEYAAKKIKEGEAAKPSEGGPFSNGLTAEEITEAVVAWKNVKSRVEYDDGEHTVLFPVMEDYGTVKTMIAEQVTTAAALA